MFPKLIHSDDQEDLLRDAGGIMQSFLDFDRHVKSASACITRDILDQYRPDKDHFAVHLIALGMHPWFGHNKNADAFTKDACVAKHQTFVTHGAMYLEHNHRSKDLSIGSIKYAACNLQTPRVELIAWYDMPHRNKKTEEIYESVKMGSARAFSMSCRIPHDVCNCCGNQAKSPADYCEFMKRRPGQWIPELQKYAFVTNPDPTFFDISDVKNNACRTALYLKYMHGDEAAVKAASVNGVPTLTGAEWARVAGVNLPEGQDFGKYQPLLEKLAAEEKWIESQLNQPTSDLKSAFLRDIMPNMLGGELEQADINHLHNARLGSVFGVLAKQACLLPPRTFFAYVLNRPISEITEDANVKKACCMLSGIFGRMLDTGLGCNPQDIDMMAPKDDSLISIDPGMSDPVNQVLAKADEKFSIVAPKIQRRTIIVVKAASPRFDNSATEAAWTKPAENSEALGMAVLYGAYKLAALRAFEQNNHDTIGDKAVFLTAAHNYFV